MLVLAILAAVAYMVLRKSSPQLLDLDAPATDPSIPLQHPAMSLMDPMINLWAPYTLGCNVHLTHSKGEVVCPDGFSTTYNPDAKGLEAYCPDKDKCDVCVQDSAQLGHSVMQTNPGFTCGGTKYFYPFSNTDSGYATMDKSCGLQDDKTCMATGAFASAKNPKTIYTVVAPLGAECVQTLDQRKAYADGNPQPQQLCCTDDGGTKCP